MKIFKITDRIEIVCDSERTRYGFRHLATLLIDGSEAQTGKCCYYNRTWESYEFQSVLYEVISKAVKNKILSEEEEKICRDYIKNYKENDSSFKLVSQIAQLGEIFCDNQKDKTDWKLRIIKAGFENKGLSVPEDWDTLDEDEKERRINGVIKIMQEK